jgi:hypothetical protein
MADELRMLMNLGANAPEPEEGAPVPLGVDEELAGAMVPADVDDLQMLVAIAQPPAKRYDQRSWQLLQHARDIRAKRKANTVLEQETQKRASSECQLQLVAMQYPGVARSVGSVAGVAPMDERRAQLAMSLSFQPTARRDSLVSLSQDRAASITVRTALRMQRECFQRRFNESTRVIDAPGAGAGWMRENKINVIDWGWDETAQKVKGKHLRTKSTRQTSSKQSRRR